MLSLQGLQRSPAEITMPVLCVLVSIGHCGLNNAGSQHSTKKSNRFQTKPKTKRPKHSHFGVSCFSYPWFNSQHWLAAAPLCWFRMLTLSTALCGNLMFAATEVMVPIINLLRSFTSQRSLIFSLLFLPSSSEATRVKPADKFLRPVCIRSLKAEPRLCSPVNSMCTWH